MLALERDPLDDPAQTAAGLCPNFNSFRRTAESEAMAGGGRPRAPWQLGHLNSNVTRTVSLQEVKDEVPGSSP